MNLEERKARETKGGFTVNLFYHVTKGCLIWMGNNLDLANAIKTRDFEKQLWFDHPELGLMDVTNTAKNLIPATAANIKKANEGIDRINNQLKSFVSQIDSSTFTISEWYYKVHKREPLVKKIRFNSIKFADFLEQSHKIALNNSKPKVHVF